MFYDQVTAIVEIIEGKRVGPGPIGLGGKYGNRTDRITSR